MVTDVPELPPPTDRFSDLAESEQFVLGALRRWLAGAGQREVLWRTLAHELAPARARAALKGLEATIRVLTAHAARNIEYHRPCCPCVGPDEIGMLTMITAVQRGQAALARLIARNFVAPERVSLILATVGVFAAALGAAGVELPLRFTVCGDAEAAAARPEGATVH